MIFQYRLWKTIGRCIVTCDFFFLIMLGSRFLINSSRLQKMGILGGTYLIFLLKIIFDELVVLSLTFTVELVGICIFSIYKSSFEDVISISILYAS